MDQAHITKGRVVKINTNRSEVAVTDGVTEPDITLSPVNGCGQPTMGFFFGIKAPTVEAAAVPTAGAFGVKLWFRDPGTKRWFSGTTTTVAFNEAFTCYDVNACDLFFEISSVTTNGVLHLHVMEL